MKLSITKHATPRWLVIVTSILALAFVGTIVLQLSSAATFQASKETESGTLGGGAQSKTIAGASGAQGVQFAATPDGSGSGTVTHGSQINTSNTGYLAWVGPQGQTCSTAQLTIYASRVSASSLGSSATCVWLKGGITIDAPITLTASRVDDVVAVMNGSVTLNYCTVAPATPGDWSLGASNFTATRSQLTGSSDGVRFGGSSKDVLIENYIRTKAQSDLDHNDGIQMYGASGGGTILRNNVSANPVGGGGGANGALFVADGATGTFEVRDNYFIGGGYTLGLHESAYYRVTGNIVEKDSYQYGPLNDAAIISGAYLEWSNNTLSDGTPF